MQALFFFFLSYCLDTLLNQPAWKNSDTERRLVGIVKKKSNSKNLFFVVVKQCFLKEPFHFGEHCVPKSHPFLMEKIAFIFHYNALSRIWNVIYMNFSTSFALFFHQFVCLNLTILKILKWASKALKNYAYNADSSYFPPTNFLSSTGSSYFLASRVSFCPI